MAIAIVPKKDKCATKYDWCITIDTLEEREHVLGLLKYMDCAYGTIRDKEVQYEVLRDVVYNADISIGALGSSIDCDKISSKVYEITDDWRIYNRRDYREPDLSTFWFVRDSQPKVYRPKRKYCETWLEINN